jgi:hypothetical protein
MIGPPFVWLIQFQTIYMLVYPACGAQRNLIVHLTCFIFLVIIAVLGVSPLQTWRRAANDRENVVRTRRFMALVGMMTTALFLLVLIAQWIAAFIVDPCAI